MAVLMSQRTTIAKTLKRRRRSATAVLAGEFDPRPKRFVLTTLLNGVSANQSVELEEKTKREKKREKRERDRERKREKAAAAREMKERGVASTSNMPALVTTAPSKISAPVTHSMPTASSFWRARPAIHIASMQRSVSITPPPIPSSPVSTPGPSISSSTSRTSSKRPYTPDDDDEIDQKPILPSRQPPKKRVAVKKGWKGWVEGSPPPSEKLINLDSVPVLQERKTRSGKAFDAIGEGKDWI